MQCIVKNCKNYWIPNSNITFHSFPKNIERRNRWLSTIPIKGKFYKSARICSLHFKIEDYDQTRHGHLLETAVPSITVCNCVSSARFCPGHCDSKGVLENEEINNFLEVSYRSNPPPLQQDLAFQQLTSIRCRFCAQTKTSTEIIDLTLDVRQKKAIVKNLSAFSGHNVDFNDKNLPETVCTVCRDTLNLCYMFLTKIRRSQIILHDYYGNKNEIGYENYEPQSTLENEPCSDTDNDHSDFDSQNERCVVKEEIVDVVFQQHMEGDPLTSVGKELSVEDADKLPNQASESSTQIEHIANKSSKDIANSPILSNLLTVKTKLLNNTSLIKKCLENNTITPRIEFKPRIESEQTSPITSKLKTERRNKQTKMAESKIKKAFSGKFTNKNSSKPKVTSTDKQRSFKCGKCGKPFLDYIRLRKHFAMHKYNEKDPHTCMLCDKVYKNKTLLKKHVQEHAGIKYECDTCGHTYNSKRQLVRHMRTATTHKPPKPLLLCNLCGKAFRRKGQLREHEAIIHKNDTS